MKQKDSYRLGGQALRSEQASLVKTILQKLSTIEDLLKRKDDKPLTFKDACAYLGYAPSYLYKLTYKNIVPHYKPTGKIIFFSKNELDEWIFKSRPHLGPLPKGEGNCGSATLTTSDPNQEEMFEKPEEVKSKKGEEELLIEFPLKSRRRKEL